MIINCKNLWYQYSVTVATFCNHIGNKQNFSSITDEYNSMAQPFLYYLWIDPVHLIHPVNPIDAVQYEETSSDSIASFIIYIIQ